DEVESGRRAPMPDEARLHVLLLERLLEKGIIVEIRLTDGQVIGRAPPSIDLAEKLGVEWAADACRRLSGSLRWTAPPVGGLLHCGANSVAGIGEGFHRASFRLWLEFGLRIEHLSKHHDGAGAHQVAWALELGLASRLQDIFRRWPRRVHNPPPAGWLT